MRVEACICFDRSVNNFIICKIGTREKVESIIGLGKIISIKAIHGSGLCLTRTRLECIG